MTRFALLVTVLNGKFRQVSPDVGEAIGSCAARLRASANSGIDAAIWPGPPGRS